MLKLVSQLGAGLIVKLIAVFWSEFWAH